MVKNLPASAGDTGLIPSLGRSAAEGNGNSLQWILAWRIPWRGELGRLQSVGSQRVWHNLQLKNLPTEQQPLIQLTIKNQPDGQKTWIDIFPKKIHRCPKGSTLLIREMQIKTTMWYHLTPIRMATVKRPQINVGQDVEKREPQYTVGGNVNWCSYYGKQYWRFLNKLKMELPYHPVIPLFGINLRKMKSLIWKDNMHPNAHSSIIYNRQDMEAINVSINRWIDKEDYYTHKHTHTKWITQPKRRMKICHLQQHRWT